MQRKIYSTIVLLFAFFFISCGIKGYPGQPFSDKPSPVQNLRAKQQGNKVIFIWEYNLKYEDGRPINKPVEFYAVSFDKKPIKLKVKKYKNLYWFEKRIIPQQKTYCFKIFVKVDKKTSEFSDYRCIKVNKNYPHKVPLKLKLTEEGILLNWSIKTSVNIYKGNLKDVPPKVYRKSINSTKFLDIHVKTENRYCYYITIPKNKYVEGIPSKTICTFYKDIFPPEPPADGFLYKQNNYALIFWDDSPSKDVKGYKVYKNKKPLFKFLLKTYYIKDKNYKKGDIYYITAVDNAGNESKPLVIR